MLRHKNTVNFWEIQKDFNPNKKAIQLLFVKLNTSSYLCPNTKSKCNENS